MSRKSNRKALPEKAVVASAGAAGLNDGWLVAGICFFLAAITFAVFGPTIHSGFVNYDDGDYVYENPLVCAGLTLKGMAVVFTHVECNFYHPLTMISLMANYQVNGLQPGGYHLVNILLHTLSAILLFLILRRMTGFTWHSAFVAAVFAIHPLRVESVAWVSERKDMLAGFFFMLTLWAYLRYVQDTRSKVRYLVVPVLFALGLLCKPNIVTLPFVLLLLDYWPLHRFGDGMVPGSESTARQRGFSVFARLVLEKIPLFLLSAAACVIAPIAEGKAMALPGEVPLLARADNSIMSYVTYLKQMFYPADLAPFYPFPAGNLSGWKTILALLVAISVAAFAARWKRPYLLVGWLWYLGILVPMIGIMQVGGFAHADRFTYLPMIGLCMALTWAAADFCAGWRHQRAILGGCAIIILTVLIFCARAQAAYWQNSESLWTHTLGCTPDNAVAHNNLGDALLQKGNTDEAIAQFQEALQINPNNARAHYNLGLAQFQKGRVDEAMVQYRQALQINPDYAEACNNLGNALLQKGDADEAITQLQQALQIKPDYAEARNNLGKALLQKGSLDEAIIQFQKALQINPDDANAHSNLGAALFQKGMVDEAIAHYQQALQINPDILEACYNLGNALLQKGNVSGAIIQLKKAQELARMAGRQGIVERINAELDQLQNRTTVPSEK